MCGKIPAAAESKIDGLSTSAALLYSRPRHRENRLAKAAVAFAAR
jgi:hypothetical protein